MHAADRRISEAMASLRTLVEREGTRVEIDYLTHEPRYRRTLARVLELAAPGSVVLDIGSHFLHLSFLLRQLGYRVIGLDVPDFVEPFRERARRFEIENHAEARFERGEFLRGAESSIDFVLFCEIQEHITFNPVLFWKRIYELLRVGGKIYLTTPNSVNTWQVLSNLKRSVLLQGSGLSIEAILGTVTYGHHWKEYSGSELRELFARLSPDFETQIEYYSLREPEPWTDAKSIARDIVRRASSRVPALREELEAVVTLKAKTRWVAQPPSYL
jgi:2-polyprenyl-6-hydroxyphenyl methylase/3-demethylubiquinone-9 3-methyltransferase